METVRARSNAFGFPIHWDVNSEWPKVKCRGADECKGIIAELGKQSLLGHDPKYTQLNLTWEGWRQLAPLTGSASGRVFIAMWFDREMDSAFRAIKGEIEGAGLIPIRVDEQTSDDKICEQILSEIHRSEFIVADFTGQRSGVYFEAGYAKALNRKVIWLCRKDQEQQLHFDTRQYAYILWSDPDDLAKQVKQKLRYLLEQARDSPKRSSVHQSVR